MKADLPEIERQIMSETVVEKIWQIPAHNGKGPITMSLRMPEITITDSEGRHIVISPEQVEMVSAKMDDIAWWIHEGARK